MTQVLSTKHSYASKILALQGLRIYMGDEEILFQDYPKDYPSLQSFLRVGDENIIKDFAPKYRTLKYEELLKKGFIIIARKNVSRKSFKGQHVQFSIGRRNFGLDYGRIPPYHKIEYDIHERAIRLVGPNTTPQGHTNWVYEKRVYKNEGECYLHYNPVYINPVLNRAKQLFNKWSPFLEEKQTIIKKIPEIIIGVSEYGLVCIEETMDAPTFGFSGERGKGKSFLVHRLVDNGYNKWGKNQIIMNDINKETQTWCMPWFESQHREILNKLSYVYEKSIPLPMVYLHPNTKELDYDKMIWPDEVGFKITLPTKKILSELNNFLKGKEDWDMSSASGRYLRGLIFDEEGKVREDGLLSKESFMEMCDFIDEELGDEKSKGLKGVSSKIKSVLKDIFNEQILDIMNNIPSSWTLEYPDGSKRSYTPWIICLMAGLVPSIVTAEIKKKDYMPQYVRFIAEDIFKQQKDNKLFENEELWLWFDECQYLFNNEKSARVIDEILREGRSSRIGVGWVVQYSGDVPQGIWENTMYYFAFNQKTKASIEIAKAYGCSESELADIKELQKFECMAMTTEKFVVYDENGKRSYMDGPIRIMTLPSISQHKSPKRIKTGEEHAEYE